MLIVCRVLRESSTILRVWPLSLRSPLCDWRASRLQFLDSFRVGGVFLRQGLTITLLLCRLGCLELRSACLWLQRAGTAGAGHQTQPRITPPLSTAHSQSTVVFLKNYLLHTCAKNYTLRSVVKKEQWSGKNRLHCLF